ncbi:MAG: amidohydrolase family protein [Algicola sp.]|nr:amidohydrolase family protein [Algicola sp.]
MIKKLVVFVVILLGFFTAAIITVKWVKQDGLMVPATRQAITLDNVNLLKLAPYQVLQQQQLVIRHGIIEAINPAGTPVAANSRYIDGNNAYVTPGLFDLHVHLWDRQYLSQNLAYGVTSVRTMAGQMMHLRWREELKAQQWLGSNLYISSPILANENTHALNEAVDTPKLGRALVQRAHNNGFDFIKAYGYLAPDVYEAIIDEATKLDMPVAKHGPYPVKGSSWQGLEGLQSLEHVEDIFQGPLNYQFDLEKLHQVAKQIKQLDVPVVPTLTTFHHLTQLSTEKEAFIQSLPIETVNPVHRAIEQRFTVSRWLASSPEQGQYNLDQMAFLLKIVKVLHQYDVKLVLGTDAGTMYTIAGLSVHKEMDLLKQAGLTDVEILRSATVNAAQTLGVYDSYGDIAVGKVADLILVQGNPGDDIRILRQPVAVVKNGHWLSAEDLAQMKQGAHQPSGYFFSAARLFEDLLWRWLF